MFMRAGRPPTLWCDLMVTDGPPVKDTDSITSGYSVPCARNSAPPISLRLLLEDVDKGRADGLALLLGVGHAGQLAKEKLRRVVWISWILKRSRNSVTTWSASPGASGRGRRTRRSAGRQSPRAAAPPPPRSTPPDSPQITRPLPTCGARLDRVRRRRAMVQLPAQPASRARICARAAAPCGRVHDLGMELHAVEIARIVGDGGERSALQVATN